MTDRIQRRCLQRGDIQAVAEKLAGVAEGMTDAQLMMKRSLTGKLRKEHFSPAGLSRMMDASSTSSINLKGLETMRQQLGLNRYGRGLIPSKGRCKSIMNICRKGEGVKDFIRSEVLENRKLVLLNEEDVIKHVIVSMRHLYTEEAGYEGMIVAALKLIDELISQQIKTSREQAYNKIDAKSLEQSVVAILPVAFFEGPDNVDSNYLITKHVLPWL